MNYISQNVKLKTAEFNLNNLSKNLQKMYKNKGKYLFVGDPISMLAITMISALLFLVILLALKASPILILGSFVLEALLYFYLIFYCEKALKKLYLPIRSKKEFMEDEPFYLVSYLNGLNLKEDDVVINYRKLEVKLNYSNPKTRKKLNLA